jgi:hypothetical protein
MFADEIKNEAANKCVSVKREIFRLTENFEF